MSRYRQIHSKIWTDPWFIDLQSDEKLAFIYLFSNDRVNVLGIYDISARTISNETDIPRNRVQEILDRFEGDGKIVRDGDWLLVVNLFTYNAMNVTSPKIAAHVKKLLADGIGTAKLRRLWSEKYCVERNQYGIDTVSIPTRTDTDTDTDTETKTETETETETAKDRPPVAMPSPVPANAAPIGADAKASPARQTGGGIHERPARAEKPFLPPAVQVFFSNTGKYPVKAWWKKIDAAVGQDQADLEFWGEVILNYIGTYPNHGNVKAMLDYFERGELPGNKPPPGKNKGNGRAAAEQSGESYLSGSYAHIIKH